MRLRNLLRLLTLTLAAGLLAGPRVLAQPAQAAEVVRHEAGVAAHAGVDGAYTRFSQGYDALDAKLVAGTYAEDALFLAPDADVLRGRAAIEASFAQFFDRVRQGGGKVAIKFRVLDRTVSPDAVYDVGYYDLTSTRDGKSQTVTGKFAVVSKRQGDDWRIYIDSYSGLAPPPKPAPAP